MNKTERLAELKIGGLRGHPIADEFLSPADMLREIRSTFLRARNGIAFARAFSDMLPKIDAVIDRADEH